MSRFVAVPGARAKIEPLGSGFEVDLPARRNWFVIVLFPIWLCGWFWGAFDVSGELLSPKYQDQPTTFLMIWLAMWLAGGIFAIVTWLWNVAGHERLWLTRDEVQLRREVFGIGFGKRYDPAQVRNLRSVETSDAGWGSLSRNPFGLGNGPLAFDYGSKTIRCGAGIDYAEAQQLVERITATATWLTSKN